MYKEWKEARCLIEVKHSLLQNKKETRKEYRKAIRHQELRRKPKLTAIISNANQTDKNLSFKLIRKKGDVFKTDLHVEDQVFNRENIIDGWRSHFSKLAVTSEDKTFNYDHLNL